MLPWTEHSSSWRVLKQLFHQFFLLIDWCGDVGKLLVFCYVILLQLRTFVMDVSGPFNYASRHLQHFVGSWKLIYFGNLTQTLCYNYVAIVVLEVTLTYK